VMASSSSTRTTTGRAPGPLVPALRIAPISGIIATGPAGYDIFHQSVRGLLDDPRFHLPD
jgi:hypothetical protein